MYVCIHGEKVAIVYITPQTDKIDAYNYVEKLGAPPHVRAVSFTELQGMIEKAGLVNQKVGSYKLDGTRKDTVIKGEHDTFCIPCHNNCRREIILYV